MPDYLCVPTRNETQAAVLQVIKREIQEEAAQVDATVGKEVKDLQTESEVHPLLCALLLHPMLFTLVSFTFWPACSLPERTL